MKSLSGLAILGFLALLIFFSYILNPFILSCFLGATFALIGLPCLIIGMIGLFAGKGSGLAVWASVALLCAAMVIVACVLAIPINAYVYKQAETAAQAYPGKIRPLLEAYKAGHGSYPKTLDLISGKPAMPRLLQGPLGYRSDGATYSFEYPSPDGMMDEWIYDSRYPVWGLNSE